jgi:hypothetical protein
MQREAINGLLKPEAAATDGAARFQHILPHRGRISAFAGANPAPP